MVSVDALFGLPRKKAAGSSHRDPLHGDLFFGDQSTVDEYVASYKMTGQNMPNVSLYSQGFIRVCVWGGGGQTWES